MKILATILLAVVLVFFGRDFIAQAAVGNMLRAATGLNLSIGWFHTGASLSSIEVKDLKLFNPRGFSEKILFHLPEVYAKYELGSFMSGKPHLKEVRLYLALLEIERNKEGQLNLSQLKPAGARKKAGGAKSGPPPSVRIDVLKVRIDKVIYKDFSSRVPTVREFDVNINKTYTNINDVRALAPLIIGDALRNSALASLINFNVSDLLQNFQASGINVADLGLDKISSLANSGLGQTAQGVAGSVVDQLGSLFGNSSRKK